MNARQTDPQTSKRAARKIKPGTYAYNLLVAFKKAGRKGLTSYEAGDATALLATGYWKRVSDLTREGYIEETGKTRTIGATGMSQRILRITPAGREHLAAK